MSSDFAIYRIRSRTNLSRKRIYVRSIGDMMLLVCCKQQFCSHFAEYGVFHGRDTAYNQYIVARITERAKFQDGFCVCTSLPIIPALFRQTRTEAGIPGDFLWDPRYPFIFYLSLTSILASPSKLSLFHLYLDKYLPHPSARLFENVDTSRYYRIF